MTKRKAASSCCGRKGLPKYQPLIRFLSEPGMKQLLQKTENFYLQDNEQEMPVVTDRSIS